MNPIDLLRAAIRADAVSVSRWAETVALREPRTVRRWLAGDSPIPRVVVRWLERTYSSSSSS